MVVSSLPPSCSGRSSSDGGVEIRPVATGCQKDGEWYAREGEWCREEAVGA